MCDENSYKECSEALARLNETIEHKLKNGTYSCESGFDDYTKDINWVTRTYNNEKGHGDMARTILKTYLGAKEEEKELVHMLVLKARTAINNGSDSFEEKYIDNCSTNITGSDSFEEMRMDSLAANNTDLFAQKRKVHLEQMENILNQELKDQCITDKEKIQKSYIENLEMKIKELERQEAENPKGNKEQLEYFYKVRANAKRPQIAPRRQESISSEKKQSERKPDTRWCRLQ